jgi:Prokaryotic Cytochrome C oxidase subunit IV
METVTRETLWRTKASVAWLVLVGLTLVSWRLGAHGSGGHNVSASLVIIVVAVFKIRLVGLYFMELRDAPWSLRGIFEGYCGGLAVLLSAMYLLA